MSLFARKRFNFLTNVKLGETMMSPIRRMVPALVMTALFPLHANAADLKWDGFLDFTYMAVDDTATGKTASRAAAQGSQRRAQYLPGNPRRYRRR